MGGTEQGLGLHLGRYVDFLEGHGDRPEPKVRRLRSGTVNHKFLAAVCDLADEAPLARDGMLEILRRQEEGGHCSLGNAIETFSASHCQLNEAASAVGLLMAVHRKNNPLIEKFRDWWWSEMALCQACLIPGAEQKPVKKGESTIWGPGWRATIDGVWTGSNSCRDLCFRLIYGHPVPSAKKPLWRDKYNLAARALSLLPEAELKALRPAPGWIPPSPYAFHARRDSGTFIAWFDAPETEKDVARVAGFSGQPSARLTHAGLYVRESPLLHAEIQDFGDQIDFPGLRA